MKNNNEEIDELIKKALSKEEAVFYENLNEQSIFEMIGGLFVGKMRWFTILNITISVALTAFAIYCLIQLLEVENTNELIRWATGLIIAGLSTSMMKIWNWNQMDKNALMRELKRLELQIASMSARK